MKLQDFVEQVYALHRCVVEQASRHCSSVGPPVRLGLWLGLRLVFFTFYVHDKIQQICALSDTFSGGIRVVDA